MEIKNKKTNKSKSSGPFPVSINNNKFGAAVQIIYILYVSSIYESCVVESWIENRKFYLLLR